MSAFEGEDAISWRWSDGFRRTRATTARTNGGFDVVHLLRVTRDGVIEFDRPLVDAIARSQCRADVNMPGWSPAALDPNTSFGELPTRGSPLTPAQAFKTIGARQQSRVSACRALWGSREAFQKDRRNEALARRSNDEILVLFLLHFAVPAVVGRLAPSVGGSIDPRLARRQKKPSYGVVRETRALDVSEGPLFFAEDFNERTAYALMDALSVALRDPSLKVYRHFYEYMRRERFQLQRLFSKAHVPAHRIVRL